MQAEGKRNIKSGAAYDKYFSAALGTYTIVKKSGGDVFDSVDLIKKTIKESYTQCFEISKVLKGSDIKESCKNIWSFIYENIQYAADGEGDEIREPIASWAERKTGVDCDCYSVLISCILQCLQIKHCLRMTMYSKANSWQHIYVVAYDEQGNEIVIDPVADYFNYEVPFLEKKDYDMQIARLGSLPKGNLASSTDKAAYLDAFSTNQQDIADKMLLIQALGLKEIYNTILGTSQTLGISEMELQAAISEGKGKSFEGLGTFLLAAPMITAGLNLLDTGLEAWTGNKLAASREQTAQAQLMADAQAVQAQAALDIEKQKAEVEKAKIDAQAQNTKMLIIGGGAIAVVVVLGVVLSGNKKQSTPQSRSRSLKGVDEEGLAGTKSAKSFKGQKEITMKY